MNWRNMKKWVGKQTMIKNKLANKNNYNLIRFWESDVMKKNFKLIK